MQNWQLVLMLWGTKYGVSDVNGLVAAVCARSFAPARVVLITDRPREGLAAQVRCVDFPPEFLQPAWMGGGCQAKLAMFRGGVVPDDMPAVFLDLDTVVLGDIARLVALRRSETEISILQSAVLPFGAFARWLWRLSGGRRYARGNSSVVVWHPAHCGFVAARFLEMAAAQPEFRGTPMRADERFLSWVAQPVMRAVPRSAVVKFPTEFMFPRLWFGRLCGALPWVRARRARLVAITLPGDEVKPQALLDLPEARIVTDHKGRRMEWSDRYLGPVRQRLLAAIRAARDSGDARS
ncbi:hypothetical protein [Pseudogemmobacter humi]|uniref:Glycosyl transferase family 8 n=1 Tax=Pseudogemmobacter humi TaxID=2483812 RepID=A0A3P5XJ17_9RHOB|nr:hypothetical protein [Pseudogemmobacter humi]VDC30158.1 hypothetical protein XINFAN_02456 [Pseudogemmobacter humi]